MSETQGSGIGGRAKVVYGPAPEGNVTKPMEFPPGPTGD